MIKESGYYDLTHSNESEVYKIIGILAQNGYAVHGNHTTEWDEFDKSKIKRMKLGWGAYFTMMAYKGIEFGLGGNFMIADMKNMKLIDFDEKLTTEVIQAIMWSYQVPNKIAQLDDLQSKCRNIREYEEYEKEIDNLKNSLSYTSRQIAYYAGNAINNGAKMPSDITSALISKGFHEKEISIYFLEIGFDGFCEGKAQITIFNFDKLNNAMVKDKDKLIKQLTEEKETIVERVVSRIIKEMLTDKQSRININKQQII